MYQQELKIHFYACQSIYTLKNIASELLITNDLILKLNLFLYPYGDCVLVFFCQPLNMKIEIKLVYCVFHQPLPNPQLLKP